MHIQLSTFNLCISSKDLSLYNNHMKNMCKGFQIKWFGTLEGSTNMEVVVLYMPLRKVDGEKRELVVTLTENHWIIFLFNIIEIFNNMIFLISLNFVQTTLTCQNQITKYFSQRAIRNRINAWKYNRSPLLYFGKKLYYVCLSGENWG